MKTPYKAKHAKKKTNKDIMSLCAHSLICIIAVINCLLFIVATIIGVTLIVAPYEQNTYSVEEYDNIKSSDVVIDLNNNEYIVIQKVKVNR